MYPEDSCGRLTVWDVVMTSKNVCGDTKEDETLLALTWISPQLLLVNMVATQQNV